MYWTWFLFVSLWMVLPGSIDLLAADWPMFQHDASRSGITADAPQLSKRERWIYQPLVGPDPAWPAPADRDYWHQIRELNPLMTFDRAFQVVASEGVVVFGSSSENKVIAVNQLTGMTKWSAFTEGPVRFAPTIWEGTVYVGCDGGWVHAWDLQTGDLRWTKNANLRDQRLPGNGKMISLFPIRTGILIEEGVAYYMAGLFPLQGVEMHAVDAKTGEECWRQVCDSVSPQGYMLSASNRLIVPTGRTSPAIFARDGGKLLQKIDDLGGSFAIVVDDLLIHQQGRQTNQLGVREPSDQKIATFDGIRMIVHEGYAFLQNKTQIVCLDRTRYLQVSREKNQLSQQFEELKKQSAAAAADVADTIQQQLQTVQQEIGRCTRELNECLVWKAETAFPYAMIKAGDNLLVGGDDMVAMLDGKTGKELWTGAVRGRAYGLAVADGDLFVSTDSGFIYCFGRGERTGLISPVVNRAPYPEAADNPVYAACAEQILKETQITKGYCLIVGLEDGQLAYELAKRSELTIVALDEDPGKVATIRQTLENTGLYGPRITVAAAAMERLPLNSYLANLIVSESGLKTGSLPCASSELFRVLRPYGGILYSGQAKEWRTQTPSADWKEWLTPLVLEEGKTVAQADGWLMLKRGRVEGNGEWTHLYAEPGNSACSQDMVDGPMTIQWFGRPGPSDIVDRHHRPMSSLFKDGRVFIPANDKVFALDAYNGTPLWSQDIPYSRRIGAMKNSGQMVLTSDLLYVAEKENCHAYAVDSGELVSIFQAPQLLPDRRQDWGYLATVGDHLYGSTNHAGAAFYELSEDTCDLLEGDFRDLILGNALFCKNRHTGETVWTYQKGVLFNSAIAMNDSTLFFVESRNPEAVVDRDGRLSADLFNASETSLIALDRLTGDKRWETPYAFPFQHIMYLSHVDGIVLAVGTYNVGKFVHYGLHAFNAQDGKPIWNSAYQGQEIGGTHGEQWQHPVIIGEQVYSRPYVFNLKTGEKGSYELDRGGHGCGGLSGSARYLYGRGFNPRRYALTNQKESGSPLSLVNRPGCWINMIPAGGLVLLPESSSGCTCSYSMQLSIAYAPIH